MRSSRESRATKKNKNKDGIEKIDDDDDQGPHSSLWIALRCALYYNWPLGSWEMLRRQALPPSLTSALAHPTHCSRPPLIRDDDDDDDDDPK